MTILEKINSLTWLKLKEILRELKTLYASVESRVDTIENTPSSTPTLQQVLDVNSSIVTLSGDIDIQDDENNSHSIVLGGNGNSIGYVNITSGENFNQYAKFTMSGNHLDLGHYVNTEQTGGVRATSSGLNLKGGFNGVVPWTEFLLGVTGASGNTYFKDNRVGVNQTGLEYFADYSSSFTSRSLIDKGYADNLLPKVADNFANDAAAAIGGIAVGKLYHTAGAVKIRLS
jgi:hypothetical protein